MSYNDLDQDLKTTASPTFVGLTLTEGLVQGLSEYTATQTLDSEDQVVICKTNAFTINLPAAASSSGKLYNIKNADSNTNDVTVDADGAETIDGETTVVLGPGDGITIVCDGTEWHII